MPPPVISTWRFAQGDLDARQTKDPLELSDARQAKDPLQLLDPSHGQTKDPHAIVLTDA